MKEKNYGTAEPLLSGPEQHLMGTVLTCDSSVFILLLKLAYSRKLNLVNPPMSPKLEWCNTPSHLFHALK